MVSKYKAVITLMSPGWLLGGTKKHESSYFDKYEDAESFMRQSIEVNRGRPGYEQADIAGQVIGKEFKSKI